MEPKKPGPGSYVFSRLYFGVIVIGHHFVMFVLDESFEMSVF
jgi:hypothetical protein